MTSPLPCVVPRLPAWLLAALALVLALLGGAALAAQDEFLEPEKAFLFSARAADDRHVEVRFQITPGYYMYRERFSVEAPEASLGSWALPAGKVKFDETFQKNVETYRGELRVKVPVDKAPARFTLNVVSQGCADAGLCYPPMTSSAQVSLAAFGGDGSVRVQLAAADAGAAAAAMTAGGSTPLAGAGSWFDGSAVGSVGSPGTELEFAL